MISEMDNTDKALAALLKEADAVRPMPEMDRSAEPAVMLKIEAALKRRARRTERLESALVVVVVAAIIVATVLALDRYFNIEDLFTRQETDSNIAVREITQDSIWNDLAGRIRNVWPSVKIYGFFAGLGLLLFFLDHKMRKAYNARHKANQVSI